MLVFIKAFTNSFSALNEVGYTSFCFNGVAHLSNSKWPYLTTKKEL